MLGLIISTLAAGSLPEAGAPRPTFASSMPPVVSAPLCGAARQVWSQQCHRCLVGVMMWLCRSYERKLYPIGVGVSNDDVNWASFPSVEVFAMRLSAMSMVL